MTDLFDSGVGELRSSLLQERKKRFEAEEKLRRVEKELASLRSASPGPNGAGTSTNTGKLKPLAGPTVTVPEPRRPPPSRLSAKPAISVEDFFEDMSDDTKLLSNGTKTSLEHSIDEEIKLLAQNEVSFDETQPAPQPKTWKAIEEEQQHVEELTKENSALKEKLATVEQKHTEATHSIENYRQRVAKLEEDLATSNEFVERMRVVVLAKNESIKALTAERESIVGMKDKYLKVASEKLQLEVDIEAMTTRVKDAETKYSSSLDKFTSRAAQVTKLTKDLEEKDAVVFKMAQKLIDLKSHINSITSQLCKLPVRQTYRLFPSQDAQLIVMHDGTTGSRRLDVVVKGKAISHPADTIKHIEPNPTMDLRFNILYTNGDTETYETDLREIIVQQLTDMLIEEKPVDALTLPPELKGYGAAAAPTDDR